MLTRLLMVLGLLWLVMLWHGGSVPFPDGAARTECRGRFFWIWLDKEFLGQSRWHYGVYSESGQYIEVTRHVASQCGFTVSTDLHRNPQLRISFLACSVRNTFDQEFSLQLRVEVTGVVGPRVPYDVTISCPLGGPWSPREIICEENYMEVSVRRAVPGIASEALNEDWIAAWPVAQGALNQVWQIVFHFQNGSLLSMPATRAHSLGYGVNTTATRVLFRAPYGTPQSEIATVEGLEVEVARATVFYKEAWMILMVDTAVACPINSPTVSATALSWVTPRILPSLVLWPERYQDKAAQMGLDGRLIDTATVARNGYTFQTDARLISITVPIGASGGLLQSAVVGNRYGTRYSINLLLDRYWQGDESDQTRHRSYRPIHTPFSSQTPLLIDDTVAAQGYFNVRLGHFLPDVEFVSVSVGGHPFSRPEAEGRGFDPHEAPNPNGTRAFGLRVPFADPLVQQQYLHGPLRHYTLHLNYTLRLVPTGEVFTQPGVVSCDVPDVVLPTFQGFCEAGALALLMIHGTLDRFWVPYVGERPLSHLAPAHNYTVSDDGHHFHLAVPLLAAGLVYESISLQGLVARLDFSLRDNKTRSVLASFAVVCTFPIGQLLVCLPNGTMVATVLSQDTQPALDPRRAHLRDPGCGPMASDSSRALFSFPLASCGTTRRFEGGYLVYENEVTFMPEGVPATSPIITRDSWYRLTLRCRYPLTETLRVWAQRQLEEDVASVPHRPVG